MTNKSSKIALFSIFLIIQFLDISTTIFIISTEGIELNPLGFTGMMILKIFASLIFGYLYFSRKDAFFIKCLTYGLTFTIIFMIFVVRSNFFQISLYLKFIQVN